MAHHKRNILRGLGIVVTVCITCLFLFHGRSTHVTLSSLLPWNDTDRVRMSDLKDLPLERKRDDLFISSYVNRHLRYNQRNAAKHRPKEETYTILWWFQPEWMKWKKFNSGLCNMSLCEYPNCILTDNRRAFETASAVIFSIVNGGNPYRGPLPVLRTSRESDEANRNYSANSGRPNRNPDQAWVFYGIESPAVQLNHRFEASEWHNVFNWSMTYRRDADVFRPYGILLSRRTSPIRNYTDVFRRKTKQVAWLVSHCVSQSQRERFVNELKKYINVDVYGRCGPEKRKYPDSILDTIGSDYKFYLSFENSLCTDYVTEKFFRYFQYDVINVVRGSAEYDVTLPNHTFVNTAHFASIKALAEYLHRLGDDEVAYTRFLREKDRYTALQTPPMHCEAMCHLCEKVNAIDANRNTYGNIFDWLGKCRIPDDI